MMQVLNAFVGADMGDVDRYVLKQGSTMVGIWQTLMWSCLVSLLKFIRSTKYMICPSMTYMLTRTKARRGSDAGHNPINHCTGDGA